MKILFINSPEPDYMQDLLYSGLVKICGSQNIYDYPFNKSYHLVNKSYPRNMGFYPHWSLLLRPLQHWSWHTFDCVIVASCKQRTIESYLQIEKHIPAKTPVIFIDGGDRPELGGDLERTSSPVLWNELEQKRRFSLIFKREYLLGSQYDNRVFPLQISMNLDRVPLLPQEKKYDISFWAVESHPWRTQALRVLEGKFDCRQNGTETNQKFHQYKRKGLFYLEELARCKIVLNVRGVGWDTMRYWEVPAVQTLMVSTKPQIKIPHDFINGQHVVHCKDDFSDLEDIVSYYLQHSEKREAIAKAGHEHLLKYHTDVARANTVLEQIKSFRGAS